jgi:hypothetical protein
MPIRGIEYAIDRIVATLQAYLPAELDLVDAMWADGLTLEDIDNGAYYKFANQVALVEHEHSIVVTAQGARPLAVDSITNSPGRVVADYVVHVEIHVKDTGNEAPHLTQSRVLRYANAVLRVLSVKHPTLGGTVFSCLPESEFTFTPVTQADDDAAGEFTGSARMPFAVRMDERL